MEVRGCGLVVVYLIVCRLFCKVCPPTAAVGHSNVMTVSLDASEEKGSHRE
jgi:hypothetical protein